MKNTVRPLLITGDYESFIQMAEFGSISAVARKTGKDVGNLSRCLVRLETQSGGQLFIRHKQGLKMTALGERLRAALLSAQTQFDREINVSRGEKVRIGFSPAIGFHYFTERFLVGLRELKLAPEFTLASSIELFESIKRRELDFIITPRQLKFPGVIAKSIGVDSIILCSLSGKLESTLIHNNKMFNIESLLKTITYENRWVIDDYFVIAKFATTDPRTMALVPEPILELFPALKRIKTFKDEGQITAVSWPGSVGVGLLKYYMQ